jgi:membrane-bound lytic murein transglycosylase D
MKKLLIITLFSLPLISTGCSNIWFEGRAPGEDLEIQSQLNSFPRPTFALTPEVQSELVMFTKKDREFISGSVERMFADHPHVYQVFHREGLPSELLAVAMVESRFIYDARSHAGAVGLWQLMPATARSFGLKVTSYHDERKDPVKATYAATGLLKELYQQFENWELALAAYNAGPSRVNRAIKLAGTRDFWTIARKGYLKNETRRFVAKVAAASIISKSPRTYGFDYVAIG